MADAVEAGREALGNEALPVDSLDAALPHLRRPFAPEAVKFKVQSVFKEAKGCLVIAYVDARLVVERLNAVCGGDWSAVYAETPKADHLFCHLTVFGITRTDVGQSPAGFSKDLVSDALKRAAVPFGVGVSIYALPEALLWASDAIPKGRLEQRQTPQKGPTLVLTEKGHADLRARYRKWLEQHGRTMFGPELSHGDVPESEPAEVAA